MKSLIVCQTAKKQFNSLAKQCLITKYDADKDIAQANAGFSLVEVVAVFLMVGILAAIAIPSWNTFNNRQRVGKANDAVLTAIQKAQQEAKNKKLKYSVSFRNNNNLPELVVHPDFETPNFSPDKKDKTFSELGIKSGQILIGSNLNNPTPTPSIQPIPIDGNTVKKITFDYNGTLPTGTTVPIKIVVASSASNITQANGFKRCVIVETLLGGIRAAKDNQCN